MPPYALERFTPPEEDILRRYFTNLDRPVFALVNLPEVVKGALFARYSRSAKSLRRLFLDEFVGDLDISGDVSVDATVGLRRAEELYDRVFMEYGDDSVAQLGGVHLACEQASNLLTKILERGRLMSYLEQSTRYVAYDTRLDNGRYRYYRDPAILDSSLGARYVGEKAFDALRGLLPAASLSNVGIYGTGQGYEALLLRMRAHPLPEARAFAAMMLEELRKVIPSFLKRVDLPDRGGAWTAYLERNRAAVEAVAARLLEGEAPAPRPAVTLVDFDPDGEDKVVAAALYPHARLPEDQVLARVRRLAPDEKAAVLRAYVGERSNRRHKPGRAFERVSYRFDVVSDYGAFRDLQRHRMLTIEWQDLTPEHGYVLPEAVTAAGGGEAFAESMDRSAELHAALRERFPARAAYSVALAYRIRYVMQLSAREAMHVIELRSSPQGHPEYRRVALIADAMGFVDHADYRLDHLERLESERRADARRSQTRPTTCST